MNTIFLKKYFGVLQRVGKSLMLPVALLPAAGLLMGIGTLLQNPNIINNIPMLSGETFQLMANIMSSSGDIVFSNLPLIFAVGVAIGMSNGDGVAALAAIVSFLIMNMTIGITARVDLLQVDTNPMYDMVLGIPTLQTGVFGGILIGMVSAIIYQKFYTIKLPEFLGFFSGKRFVPIVAAIAGVLIGIIMVVIWPPIQNFLLAFSRSMIGTNQTVSALIFGIVERALIPFGLHHIWYNPFWYQFGEYTNLAGQLVVGDQAIFFAQLKDGVEFTAGTFMTGKFPFMMFGLPAAALAMYHEADSDKKKLVAGILFSGALTSFLTGITEPIEFMFLFVAPVLFGVHCIFAGLSFMIMQILNVKVGLTFSGGLIDFILFGVLPNRTKWWWIILVGIIFAAIYYIGFRYIIRKLDLKTPGREREESEIDIKLDTMVLEIEKNKRIHAINSNDGYMILETKAIILAMGCRERTRGAINIPGDRPSGVYTAGAAQRYINMEGYMPGKEVVILGSGDIGLIMARRMTLEGAKVKAVVELMPYSNGLNRNIVQCLEDYNIPLYLSHTVVDIIGDKRVEKVIISKVDENKRPMKGTEVEFECDTLLLSVGLIPENELSDKVGIELDRRTNGLVVTESMETNVDGIFACGNVVHVHDLVDFVTEEAKHAGKSAAKYLKNMLKKEN